MLYRIFVVVLALLAAYAIFNIVYMQSTYARLERAEAFQTTGPEDAQTVLVGFLDYNCAYCRDINGTIHEALTLRPDVRYILRPIAAQDNESVRLAKIALAAGLQGRFWDISDAFLGHDGEITDAFIEETAGLYGIDYDRMMEDAQSDQVDDLYADNLDVARRIYLKATPTFVIGRRLYVPEGQMPNVAEILRVLKGTD